MIHYRPVLAVFLGVLFLMGSGVWYTERRVDTQCRTLAAVIRQAYDHPRSDLGNEERLEIMARLLGELDC